MSGRRVSQSAALGLGAVAALVVLGCNPDARSVDPPTAANAERPLFTEVTVEVGLAGTGASWPDGVYFLPEIMQGGVGLLDYDGDGDLDILHARIPPPGRLSEPAPNRLYRRKADGRYVDVTEQAGIADPGFGQAVAVGDVDNDGDMDVYFANYGPDSLYRNNGDGTFTEATKEAGFSGGRWSTGAAFCDYDRDGFLDLYVVHYVKYDVNAYCQDYSGRREYCGPQTFHGEPDRLYHNTGHGTFRDVTAEAGIVLPDGGERARGLGVACADVTGDGWVDFYVTNDAESNQLWVNRGNGTFSDQAIARGVAVNRHGKPEGSMGIAVGDVDGDGTLDVFVTNLFQEHNTLYLGGPGGLLFDRGAESGLSAHDYLFTGFGCGFFDYDHDADLDLAVVNGRVRRGPRFQSARLGAFWDDYAETHFLFQNDGHGVFENISDRAGSFGLRAEVGRGLGFGDLDDDGDVDLVVSNVDNSLRVFRNDAPRQGTHWLRVRALTRGRDALGARLTLRLGSERIVSVVQSGYSYGSSNDPRVHWGLGGRTHVDGIEVAWPDGETERFAVPGVDRELTLVQGRGARP